MREGHDEPVELEGVHEEDPARDEGQRAQALLVVLREQVDGREHELAHHDEVAEEVPVAAVVVVVEDAFLGDVGVPDEEVLAEGDVGPEDGEAEEHLAHEVEVLGVEHPDTLLSIGNLEHTYNNQGRYEEAEELLVQVMNIRIRVLGKVHPHTLSGMSNLGVSYHNQGRWDEAETIQSQVVAAREVLLGPEHFSTLTSMSHLSLTYHSQGRRLEAEELGLQVMKLRKKVLGPEHHHTLTSMGNLASIYLDGNSLKAEELLLQVLAIRIKVLGMGHHHSVASMVQLADMYRDQGRLKEAENMEAQIEEARNLSSRRVP